MSGDDRQFYGVSAVVELADATTVEVSVPAGSVGHLMRVHPVTVGWEFAWDKADLDASDGFPMAAGEALAIDRPLIASTFYVRQASGAPAELRLAYLRPRSE